MSTDGASEQRDIETVLELLPGVEAKMPILLKRFEPHWHVPPGARVLDVGAAQGMYITALKKLGYDARGVEPWRQARETSRDLVRRTGVETDIVEGRAEDLPFGSEEFDLVIAASVMEHVEDPVGVFREIRRVLRPGGAFYFHTTSKLGRKQNEIAGFPLFPWYPDPLKRRIMRWAVDRRPSLVGGTAMPAYNWFTPWGLRRDLTEAGFRKVVERWNLMRDEELDGWRRRALRLVRSNGGLRFAGEFLAPGSGYLAIIGTDERSGRC
jgi:SAM-dependent methyltransferase